MMRIFRLRGGSGRRYGHLTSALNSKEKCPACGRTITRIGNAYGGPGRWARHNRAKGVPCENSGKMYAE